MRRRTGVLKAKFGALITVIINFGKIQFQQMRFRKRSAEMCGKFKWIKKRSMRMRSAKFAPLSHYLWMCAKLVKYFWNYAYFHWLTGMSSWFVNVGCWLLLDGGAEARQHCGALATQVPPLSLSIFEAQKCRHF